MLKTKKILIALMLLIAVLLIPNMVNAAVEYTRTIPSNDGTIKINFTGLTLEQGKVYEFALVRQNRNPETWFSIDDGYTTETATITLSANNSTIVDVLKETDTGYIYIREENNTTDPYVLSAYEVNLKLPYLQSLAYVKETNYYNCANQLYGSIGNQYSNIDVSGDGATYSQWVKVTSQTLITEYLDIKNNNGQIVSLENSLPEPPITGYEENRKPNFESKNDGLYLLWVKRTGQSPCKEVFSCIVHDGLPNATTLEEYVGSVNGAPTVDSITARGNSGNLTTIPGTGLEWHPTVGDEITVNIKFNQSIVKNTAPTLTIKFGTGSNIELTTCEASSDTLTYKYTIKEGDLGTLQIASLSGGNVTNNEGTAAVLTLPEVSGYTLVAVEADGTQEEPTEPVDTTTYVSFPFIIYNGKSSVDLKSGVYDGDYTMYYQFVEVSDEVYNKLEDLKEKYENNEITYEEYFVQYNSTVTKYNDTKWIKTEDGSFEQDLSKFIGTKKFALWVKLVMEDKTVYEAQVYTMNGSGSATNEPQATDKTDTSKKDTTTAKNNLPDTGRVLLFWIIGIVAVSAVVAHIRYQKLYIK